MVNSMHSLPGRWLIVFLLLTSAALIGSGENITHKGNVADLSLNQVIDTNAHFTWTARKQQRVKSYQIKVFNKSNATVYSVALDGVENNHDVKGLDPNTEYRISILAVGPGVSGNATELSFTTLEARSSGPPTDVLQIAPASRNYSDRVELKWTTKDSGGPYVRWFRIWFRKKGGSCEHAVDYAERWSTGYNISLLPPNMTFEINIAAQGALESLLGPKQGITRSTIEAQEESDDEEEEDQKEDGEEWSAKSFNIDVSGTWSDVIRIDFDRNYVEKLDITRVYSDGQSEFVASLRHASYYDTGISVLRALSFYRSCYHYKVHLTITTASNDLTEESEEICTGPGSPAAEQVKFWIFTSLLAILMVAIFAIALRHELRREAYLIGDKMTLQNVGTMALSRERSREAIGGYKSAELDANRSSKGQPMIVPLSYADNRKGGKA